MVQKEINTKYFETLAVKQGVHSKDTIACLDVVRRYIIREKKILVGGMAIDFALKLRGAEGIYADDVLPDYDFYSHEHFRDAYDIAQWLNRLGFKNISVINAMHPTTMKVRVNFAELADITFIPKSVLDRIPTLNYKGYVIAHPHFQMIDQHISLSYPYTNAPWETILQRWGKDMKRYDILYDAYPLKEFGGPAKFREVSVATDILSGQCITGFAGLSYWIELAKSNGYTGPVPDFCKFAFVGGKVVTKVTEVGLTVISDNYAELVQRIGSKPAYFERLLDKINRRVLLPGFEIILAGSRVAASRATRGDFHVANLQHIMAYILTNYVLNKAGRSYYSAYLACRALVEWAGNRYFGSTLHRDSILLEFLPTASTYGKLVPSDSYKLSKLRDEYKNKGQSRTDEDKKIMDMYAQPSHVYDSDLKYRKVPTKYYEFSYDNSLIFNMDGRPTKPFEN